MTNEILITNKGFSDINPVICGYEICKKGHSYGPNMRNYYLIHYIKKGKGRIISPFGEFSVTANQFFIIRPNEVNTYIADENEPWEYIWIGFNGSLAEIFSRNNKIVYEYNGNVFSDIVKCEKISAMREEFIVSKLFMLIYEVFKTEDYPTNYIQMTTDYIDANFMRDITVEDIASKIGLNRRYLSRIFKKEHGITVQEYLIKKRMEQAKNLLTKNYRVCEVAEMVGYKDVFNFSKMFRKNVGISPKFFLLNH